MELNNSTHEDRESAIRRAANTAWREMKKDPDSFQFNTLDKALDKTVNDFFADKETLDRVCSAMTSMWPIGRHYRPMVIVKALKNQYKFEIFDVTRVNKICVPEKLDMPYYELTPYKDLGRALVAFADWVECLNEVGWVAPRKGQTAGTTRRHHPKYLETLLLGAILKGVKVAVTMDPTDEDPQTFSASLIRADELKYIWDGNVAVIEWSGDKISESAALYSLHARLMGRMLTCAHDRIKEKKGAL